MDKKIEPTDAMVDIVDLADKLMVVDTRDLLRYALNHPDAAGLFTDEDTLRAAREQGWDQATRWIDSYQGGPNGRTTSARSANPHRAAQELPTEDGAVIVPAEGRYFIHADGRRYFARLTYSSQLRLWYGIEASGGPAWAAVWYGEPEKITPGTWKVADQ